MKRTFLFIITTFALCTGSAQGHYWDFWSVNMDGDTLYYVVKNDSSVYIVDKYFDNSGEPFYVSSYRYGYDGHIAIPSVVTYNDTNYEVVGIADFTFVNCYNIYSIMIPNTVTYIGFAAFAGSGLQTITIPMYVNRIREAAFMFCDELKTLNFNAIQCKFDYYHSYPGWQDSEPVFMRCNALTEVNIGNSVKKIPSNFINDCNGLNQIAIPNNVDTIGQDAFKDCPNLVHISLGSGIKHIGKEAFSTNPLGSIICYMEEPPTLNGDGVFGEATLQDARVIIPCNTRVAYQNAAGWSEFAHFIDPCVDLLEVETTEFSLYPNPATTELNIACSTNIETIEIFNILGQKVYASQVKSTSAKVNTSNFVTGNYIAKLYTDNGITTKKFIVK